MDWLSFKAQCLSELTEEAVMSAKDPARQFTDLLIQTAGGGGGGGIYI